MNRFEKIAKVTLALVVIGALSSFSGLMHSSQKAQVLLAVSPSAFSVFNRNEIVLEAQTILKNLGLYDGKLSGLFGFKTRDALFDYQTLVGIPRTGILDIPTQEKLFAPVAPPVEYTLVNNTKTGNQFLYEWVQYQYGQAGDLQRLEGILIPEINKGSYGQDTVVTEYSLVVESVKYSVQNISSQNLKDFSDIPVKVLGRVVTGDSDDQNLLLVINYVFEDLSQENYFPLGYTIDGNYEAQKWIEKRYDRSGQYVQMNGNLVVVDEPMRYLQNGNTTRTILVNEDKKYAIENISRTSLERLAGQNVSLRGFLLEGENEQGYPTIVVNYFR